VAPPRLLPGGGFVDVVALSGTFQSGDGAAQHANAFGSMPSLHAGWAIWVALTVMTMTTRWWVRGLAWLHVGLTFVVVIITGNHYLIDIVAGAATVAVAWSVAPLLSVRRVPAVAVAPAALVD
jgi:diacylglycerol O-acyltransferase